MDGDVCELLFILGMLWEVETVMPLVTFSLETLDDGQEYLLVDSFATKFVMPVISDLGLAMPATVTFEGTRENKIFSVGLE